MVKVLLACRDCESISVFKTALAENNARTTCLSSGSKVLFAVSDTHYDLLVVDEKLDDISGLELVQSVIQQNPMLNCAVMSSLSPDDFHQASEGLGILMRLPLDPGRQEAERLLKHLEDIQTSMKSSRNE